MKVSFDVGKKVSLEDLSSLKKIEQIGSNFLEIDNINIKYGHKIDKLICSKKLYDLIKDMGHIHDCINKNKNHHKI